MPNFSDNNRRRSSILPRKKRSLRLLLGDRHQLLLEMLAALLEPEFAIAGTATDGPALLRAAQSLRPDIVLLDVGMPQVSGIEIARRLQIDSPGTGIILLGTEQVEDVIAAAFKNGACGYLLKAGSLSEVREAIWTVANGAQYLTPAIAGGDIQELNQAGAAWSRPLPPPLTIEIVRLLLCGLSIRTIALQLAIAPRAVERHQHHAMALLGARDDHELIALAVGHGWLAEPPLGTAWDSPVGAPLESRSCDQIAADYRRKADAVDCADLQDAYRQLAEGYEALEVWQDVVLAAGDIAHALETDGSVAWPDAVAH